MRSQIVLFNASKVIIAFSTRVIISAVLTFIRGEEYHLFRLVAKGSKRSCGKNSARPTKAISQARFIRRVECCQESHHALNAPERAHTRGNRLCGATTR